MSRPTIQNREYAIHYTETLNWEDDFQRMAFDLSGWVMDLYRMIWDLEPSPASTQLPRLERIEQLHNRHKDDAYESDEMPSCVPENYAPLNELDEKLQIIQAHAQYMSILEMMQIELLEALTYDIMCNDNGQFVATLDKWIDTTRDALSASPM